MRILIYTSILVMTVFSVRAQTDYNAHLLKPDKVHAGSEFNLTLDITTDCWPEETSWELVNAEGELVHEGGPYYGQELSDISEGFWLESGSYTFSFYDAAGDGLFATQWGSLCGENGSFELVDAADNILLSDDGDTDFDTLAVSFEFNATVSIEESTAFPELVLYPNPASDVLNISIQSVSGSPLVFELIASNGDVIRRESHVTRSTSTQTIALSMANLPVGIYTLRLFSGQNSISERVVKVR